LKLIIVHYHLRPGGVRRIIELAAPHLIKSFDGDIDSIILAAGEAPDERWLCAFKEQMKGTPVELFVDSSFGYLSELRSTGKSVQARLRKALARLLDGANTDHCVVWCHNPSVGRNLALSRELVKATESRSLPLVCHHHDWWFDNRWARWPEMRRSGFRSFNEALKSIFPASPKLCHATINREDLELLQNCFPHQAHWLPNLAERPEAVSPAAAKNARKWLAQQLGTQNAPVWLLPCRMLRRKNVAEALLLTRWLAPDAWLVTTGGVSSADEQFYATALESAAKKHGWPLKVGCLKGDETGKPSVPELLAASDAVILSSILEGFGLPYVEAAAAGRPLIARTLPNIAPDLAQFGFRFPQSYEEILVSPSLFDWPAEAKRQTRLYRNWRLELPRACRAWAGVPTLLAVEAPAPVPFSRLTLTAQLEVMAKPIEESWTASLRLNPFLLNWRKRAAAGKLRVTPWPRAAKKWLGGPAYAAKFWKIVQSVRAQTQLPDAPPQAQKKFVEARLDSLHQFPLLWSDKA
jgi:glycosyltransferase involved in cell wall biosynthesis